jgi:AraC family transcriptional regulator
MDLSCVYNTLSFIEQNYNKPISVEDLERVSFYSYRNIQRIFKYTCNETIGSYQQRLKVENAYKLLLYTRDSLTQISMEVGFESLAAFSKAFKQHFGVSPKEARMKKETLFQQHAIHPIESAELLKPEIVYLPPITLYYQSIHTEYANAEIEALWEDFNSNLFPPHVEYFGLIADEPLITEKIKCRYDAGCTAQALNKKLPKKTILGGRYAKFIHAGSYDTLDEIYTKIYAGWILQARLEFDYSPIIERYLQHSSNTESSNSFKTEILIPLKK